MSSLRHLVEAQTCWPATDPIEGWADQIAFDPAGLRERARVTRRRRALKRIVEIEVLPRLIVAHAGVAQNQTVAPKLCTDSHPNASEVAELARLVVHTDTDAALAHVEIVQAHGVALDNVLIELLAPAAELLGELWQADTCSFVDVTIGLSRLQQILRDLSSGTLARKKTRPAEALLVALPGDQHGFGVFMLQDFFRRAGWHVSGGIPPSISDLIDVARAIPFNVIGLSVSCDASPDDLCALIRTMRRNALNRKCQILVGGRFFIEHPELVERVGADATATDGRLAVRHLSSFLDT